MNILYTPLQQKVVKSGGEEGGMLKKKKKKPLISGLSVPFHCTLGRVSLSRVPCLIPHHHHHHSGRCERTHALLLPSVLVAGAINLSAPTVDIACNMLRRVVGRPHARPSRNKARRCVLSALHTHTREMAGGCKQWWPTSHKVIKLHRTALMKGERGQREKRRDSDE